MNIFLKIAPYLIILALGFGIYYGFNYMSDKISEVQKENQILTNQVSSLKTELENKNITNKAYLEQIEQLQKNETESMNNILDNNKKVDNMELKGNREKLLKKINEYEKCISENSLKPHIKCELNI